MGFRLKRFILSIIVIYGVLLVFSVQIANFLLAVFLVALVPWLGVRMLFIKQIYNDSSKLVEKHFVVNKNKIQNANCIVQYNPNRKILISDNLTGKQKREKRLMVLSVEEGVNVNKAWYQICRIFDEYTYFDTLAAFFTDNRRIKIQLVPTDPSRQIQQDSSEENIVVSSSEEDKKGVKKINITVNTQPKRPEQTDIPEYVDIKNITPDTYSQNNTEIKNNDSQMVEMDNLLTTRAKMIDVNHSNAEQLATLPGVNIIIAKRIIDYRNKNGLFKSPEEFFQIAGIKEHFAEKAAKQIFFGKSSSNNDDDSGQARIVDI